MKDTILVLLGSGGFGNWAGSSNGDGGTASNVGEELFDVLSLEGFGEHVGPETFHFVATCLNHFR